MTMARKFFSHPLGTATLTILAGGIITIVAMACNDDLIKFAPLFFIGVISLGMAVGLVHHYRIQST
jgi:hypothetical protein